MQAFLSTGLAIVPRDDDDCEAFDSDFPAGSVVDSDADSSNVHFIATSPKGSFTTGNGALELKLQMPDGDVTAKDGINDKVGVGATVNATKPMSHGKVTFVAETPKVAGVVSAMILIGSDSQDEVDIEILGGDIDHWQTNFFATPPGSQPIFGKFGGTHGYNDSDASSNHTYVIDWNQDRISWSVDGDEAVRNVQKKDSTIGGQTYYPTHKMRMQMGIWDASGEAGSASWAKGPIDWKSAPGDIRTLIYSVKVEC
ncbi:concanavalin A-like lectin/glucanase [Armillaria nabsnona]|nr:concanavalin A-like lectin/glucanase [Armillaria nabsnona]